MTGGHRRILIVEDDPETAGQLLEQLTASGYEVDLAASGNDALRQGAACDYAVITIDRMLPDIDGIAVMRQLRDDGVAAPFLIISALGEIDDRVRGLRAGGDDYLVKPFSFVELLARLEALGRRSTPQRKPSGSAISRSTSSREPLADAAKRFSCCPKNFTFWSIWRAMRAASCRALCYCSTSGMCISIPRQISSTSLSGACVARSTTSRPLR
jgi:two-component system OmpR family response regulator